MPKSKTNAAPTAELLSVPEAATVLGVSRATVYRQVEQGNLISVRLGGRRLFTRAELARFISSLEVSR